MVIKRKPLAWDLAPAPGSKDHVRINGQYELFIGGKWRKPRSGTSSDTDTANNG